VEFCATLTIEVRIVSYRLAADIAHGSTTRARHFVTAYLLDKLLLALPTSPATKQVQETGPQI
jgi:hypothetical protein